MSKISTTLSWTIGLLLVINLLLIRDLALGADGTAHLHVMDVGQGDGILLMSPSGKQILIDGGPDWSVLEGLGKLMPFFDRTIELLIITHPDKDHVSGLPEVLKRYHVERVMLTGVEHDLGKYQELIDLIDEQNIPVILPDPKIDIDIGDGLVLDILWPDAKTLDPTIETNSSSITLRAIGAQKIALLTGDLPSTEEDVILLSGQDVRADILKLGHHGSRYSTSNAWLGAVRPSVAIVSAGKDNTYGHPSPEVIDRLEKFGVTIRSTMEGKTVRAEL